MTQKITAIGLMSGTSLDGIDAALIHSDGEQYVKTGEALTIAYPDALHASLHAFISGETKSAAKIAQMETELTLHHADAVKQLLEKAKLNVSDVDMIGFHGQTVAHNPAQRFTWQLGDGALLAKETGIAVVCDFRSNDVAQGGQGAPLVSLYHAALIANQAIELPIAIVNIGGVANVTYIGKESKILAFDTGPGNALINDWVQDELSLAYDTNGEIASRGKVNEAILETYLSAEYFSAPIPKSLDRQDFSSELVKGLSHEDGAATLTALTTRSIAKAEEHFPVPVSHWYICGGGRHNGEMMRRLDAQLNGDVHNADTLGWDSDALEAQAFAYLAIRSRKNLPLSLPQTTGVSHAAVGGVFYPV